MFRAGHEVRIDRPDAKARDVSVSPGETTDLGQGIAVATQDRPPRGRRAWRVGPHGAARAISRLPVPFVVDHMGHFPASLGVKEQGFQSGYLKPVVVARINPLRWIKTKPGQPIKAEFDKTIDKMIEGAKGFDASKVKAADIAAAAALFQDHPHITIFPGDGIDVMPVVTGPPED